MDESFPEAFRQYVEERHGSIPKLAQKIGVSSHTIYSARNNGFGKSSYSLTTAVAHELGLDPEGLALNKLVAAQDKSLTMENIPLVGRIAAGEARPALDSCEQHPVPYELHERYPNAFYLRVSGESMNRLLPNGSFALVDPRDEFDVSGAIYAVAVDRDDATIKRVRILGNGVELVPESSDATFHASLYDFGDAATPEISPIGRVVWYWPPEGWDR